MKKIIILAALMGAAAVSANAGVQWNISVGLPLPVVISQPVFVQPVAPPPAPPVVVEASPVCPGPDYVWVGGYWSYQPTGYVWVHGGWCHHPARVIREYNRGYRHW
jgi:WXXGXW repeat (2 copies)